MLIRICADVVIFLSILFFTPWMSFFLVVVATFYFRNFYEAVAVGVIIDVLYGVPLARFFQIPLAATGMYLLVYFAVNRARELTRFYEVIQ